MAAAANGLMGVAILGFGTVGQAVARLLTGNAEAIARRAGCELRPIAALVRNDRRPRGVAASGLYVTSDVGRILGDPAVHLVVDAMGGLEPARGYVLRALASGRPVAMANKQLLSTCGKDLFEAAAAAGVDLFFEASVCSGVPVLRALREGLAGDRVTSIAGVLNGTTNYILTRMEHGASLSEAVAEAQACGIAEADPATDLEGRDPAWKLAILASIAFGRRVAPDMVETRGLDGIAARDLELGAEMGLRLKLLATAKSGPGGAVEARVEPAFVPREHPLAQVEGADNAVLLVAKAAGRIVLTGPGAGGDSAAAAIVADLIEAARNLRRGIRNSGCLCRGEAVRVEDKPRSRFLVRVPNGAAGRLAGHGIGLQRQLEIGDETVVITDPVARADLIAVLNSPGQGGRAGMPVALWDGAGS